MKKWIVINPEDLVGVALTDLPAGFAVELPDQILILSEDIPRGHKFSLRALEAGEAVVVQHAD